ncbi:hypothetical protein, partial [Enterococcus lactis]|uniref:hypothetical protein n=1 Tax=Enterococcus lactis TaxID=357441 RepID=UPI001C7CE715
WCLNSVVQEFRSLPFNVESQVTIFNKHEKLFFEIVPCDRGVGRRTPFSGEVVKKLSCIK